MFQGQSPRQEHFLQADTFFALAGKTGFSVETVRESLVEYATDRLITLGSWRHDLHRPKMFTEWDDVKQMFFNPDDQNGVRVSLLPRGEEYVKFLAYQRAQPSEREKNKIGFLA